MRVVTVTHLDCRLERILAPGRNGAWLWREFCETCRDLLPRGEAVVRGRPVPSACWLAGSDGRVRLLFLPVSDGTELVLQADVGRIPARFDLRARRYSERLRRLLGRVRDKVERHALAE